MATNRLCLASTVVAVLVVVSHLVDTPVQVRQPVEWRANIQVVLAIVHSLAQDYMPVTYQYHSLLLLLWHYTNMFIITIIIMCFIRSVIFHSFDQKLPLDGFAPNLSQP